MKFLIATVVLFQAFFSTAQAASSCRFWEPNQTVEVFDVDKGAPTEKTLLDRTHYLKIQYLLSGELSIALLNVRTKDLTAVARGTKDITLSVMEPRVSISCYAQAANSH